MAYMDPMGNHLIIYPLANEQFAIEAMAHV